MFTLDGENLKLWLLDPVADADKLGSRYCSGGYVWQLADARHGELLSGPCFPSPSPPPFDGQGLPEVFEIALGQDTATLGQDVWVIGVGRVRADKQRHQASSAWLASRFSVSSPSWLYSRGLAIAGSCSASITIQPE